MNRRIQHLLPWIIAAIGILAIPAWLLFQQFQMRELSVSLDFRKTENQSPITQDQIDAVLGKGYPIVRSSVLDFTFLPSDARVVKLVVLKVPQTMSGAEVIEKLRHFPRSTRAEIN